DVPFKKLSKDVQDVILHGSGEREIKWKWKSEKGEYNWSSAFKGLVPLLEGKYKEVESEDARTELENYMSASPCPACKGRRLKPEALAVLVEPSIGLHAKDNRKLIDTLMAMRDLGNTVVVVEHDEETIRLADRVVDLGPGAGL